MKKLIPVYIISFVLGFMLYIYEPITMYLNNVNDFWFDLSMIIKPLILYASVLFIGISLCFTALYFISKKLFKKEMIFDIAVLVLFVGFICTYIQGNYLAGNLPALDGSIISWSKYTTETIISIILWCVVIGVVVFTSIKFKTKNVIKVGAYLSLAILFMLSTSLISVVLTKDTSKKNQPLAVTMKNYNSASTDKNFFIFLLDAVDSVMLDEAMESDSDYKDTFKDFTYYKDTMSTYAYTRDSIPYILTNIWNENEDDFRTYSTKAYDNSEFFKVLKDKKYQRNLYEEELTWESKKIGSIDNVEPLDKEVDLVSYFKHQTKYILYKYLPYGLKKYSKVEYMNFNNTKKSDGLYFWPNHFNYWHIKDDKIEKQKKKVFSFYHLEGAHVPCMYNKKVEHTSNESYKDTLLATLTVIDTYLNRLKQYDVYDNSVIIIMADHGFALGNGPVGRQNPMLFIKGIDEHHDMIRSDLPISYTDLYDAYIDLLDDKKSTELFADVDYDRERRFLWYEFTKENHMVEYIQRGKAWDENTLKRTGKEFNR